MFRKFHFIPGFDYSKGWDKYALDYQNLLVKDTVYYLTKEMMHLIVDKETDASGKCLKVLDVNCGTGNDFPFFFDRNWQVDACDGSPGMLNKAAENYNAYLENGHLNLYLGLLEELENNSFEGEYYDLIFSVTGGFSYVDDEQLMSINKKLKGFLKKDGKLIVAHLNSLCLPEMIYRALKLKNPFYRLKSRLNVNIKNEDHFMYLRNPGQLKKIYLPDFGNIKFYPLLALTPPYQSNYKPTTSKLNAFRRVEKSIVDMKIFSRIADQIVTVCSKDF